jgi:recombinase/recombinase-like zinc beta ribbon protein
LVFRIAELQSGGESSLNEADGTSQQLRELMNTLESWRSKMERKQTVTRVRNAARKRFDAGLVVAGRVYGYDNQRLPGVKASAKLVVNEEQAAIVRRIFRMTAEGVGLVRIAKTLNAEGIAGPQRLSDAKIEKLQHEGRPVPTNKWQATGVREVLYREHYIGRVAFGKVVRTGPKQRVRVPRDKWQWAERPELAILTQEEWDAAHARIRSTSSSFLRSKGKLLGQVEIAKGKAMLSGFLICGAPALSPREHGGDICGEPLIASTRGREELPVYVCRAVRAGKGPGYCDNRTAIPRADLHATVIASLRKTKRTLVPSGTRPASVPASAWLRWAIIFAAVSLSRSSDSTVLPSRSLPMPPLMISLYFENPERPGVLPGRPHRDGRGQDLPQRLARDSRVLVGLGDPVGPGRLKLGCVGRRHHVLVVGLVEVLQRRVRVLHLLREEDEPETPRPIAGGSDAGDDVPQGCRGYEVGSSDMAPKPPTARGTPAEPWRPSMTRECHEATSGRRSAHGRARSNAAAAWSTVTSARRRPTICRPTGSPAGVNPAGTVTAGWPVKLNG